MKRQYTLGSLFDGIGGFPLAGQITERIKTVWAAEIEPNCISITRRHFPDVLHLGDISELRGDEIQPVDIISFGSPCQDLSVAGQQRGLDGNRSGLFLPAVRIIQEMREATHGEYPKFIIWENVPGAFSSNDRKDFQRVLEEITETEISIPPSGEWANAGLVRGGAVDVAWRILDAEYWGVPQRRKRIYLVGDIRRQRADEVLFKPESLLGYSAKSKEEAQNVTTASAYGVRNEDSGITDRRIPILNPSQPDNECFFDISPTLLARMGTGGNQVPIVAKTEKTNVIPIKDEASRQKNSNGMGVGEAGGMAYTLTSSDQHAVFYEAYQHHGYRESKISGTLTAGQNNTVRGDTPIVVDKCFEENQFGGYRETTVGSPLRASGGGSYGGGTETLVTTTEKEKTPGNIPSKPSIRDILNGAVQKVKYIIRRLTPRECERLQGFPDDWTRWGVDGTEIADTNRYKAIGNSIAVNCAIRVFLGIIEVLDREEAA